MLTPRVEAEARRASRVMSVAPSFFGERNVRRIICRQVMPEPPNVWQENEVGIAGYAKIEQILERLIGALCRNFNFPHEPPENLRHLKIQKVRSMKRFAARVNSALNLSSDGGLKKPVNRR